MPPYLKKVEAIQFKLTDEQKALIKSRKPVYFEGGRVKHAGADHYITLLQQGENLIKIQESQWLVRHPDGLMQIFWPDRFGALFLKESDTMAIPANYDPFKGKS